MSKIFGPRVRPQEFGAQLFASQNSTRNSGSLKEKREISDCFFVSKDLWSEGNGLLRICYGLLMMIC